MINTSNPKLKKILTAYHEIHILSEVSALLGWDQNTYMPPAATENRAKQITLIAELVTDKWNHPGLKSLIESMKDSELNDTEKAVMRNIRHVTKYYFKVPKETILKFAGLTSKAFSVWHGAKEANDFKAFEPYLAEIVKLKREIAGHLGSKASAYDALLDLYEPGLTSADCEKIFSYLKPRITKLLKMIVASGEYKKKNQFIERGLKYNDDQQRVLTQFLLSKMTYPTAEGRLDVSPHPFTTTIGSNDVRITTKYHEDDIRSAYASTIHEAGHGLYELGVNPDYSYTPFAGGASLGIHESQSRFWENQIGRSPEYISYLYPVFQTLFPNAFSVSAQNDFIKYVNHVKPGFIRIEADEVTYNLHIILRFEIESALVNGKLAAKDVPEVWREKMHNYFGIVPSTDREGCLQDVHWSYGDMGYFPTYCLGTLFAAQFTENLKKELNFDELISRGELAPIRDWLQKKIHIHGSRYKPKEIIKKVTGEDLNPKYFVDYLNRKYSAIYSL